MSSDYNIIRSVEFKFYMPVSIPNTYNKNEVDNLISNTGGSKRTIETSFLTQVLSGSAGIQMLSNSNDLLFEASSAGVSALKPLTPIDSLTVYGDGFLNKIYYEKKRY